MAVDEVMSSLWIGSWAIVDCDPGASWLTHSTVVDLGSFAIALRSSSVYQIAIKFMDISKLIARSSLPGTDHLQPPKRAVARDAATPPSQGYASLATSPLDPQRSNKARPVSPPTQISLRFAVAFPAPTLLSPDLLLLQGSGSGVCESSSNTISKHVTWPAYDTPAPLQCRPGTRAVQDSRD